MNTTLQNKRWLLLAMGIGLGLSPAFVPGKVYAGSATTLNVQAPPASVLNPRIASGDARVTLTWDLQTGVKHNVMRSTSQSGTYQAVASNLETARYEDTNVQNNTTYYYKIVAVNNDGSSPETAVMSAMPMAGRHAYYNFNETAGTVAVDMWGGHHATLQPTATREASQPGAGQALKLDGSATAFALLPPGVVSTLNDFTISNWVKMDEINWWMRVFDFGTGENTNMFLTVQGGWENNMPVLRYAIRNNGSAEQAIFYPFAFPLNTWVHLTVTQAGNTASLYVNGTMVGSNANVTIKPSDMGNTNLNYIGKAQYNDPLLRGSVDEFRIYNRALSAAEITALASNMVLTSRKEVVTDVSVYPNPATSAVTISGLDNKAYQYQLYNLVGSKVAEGTVLLGRISLPANIANGNYMLQVTDSDKTDIRKRIVIQN